MKKTLVLIYSYIFWLYLYTPSYQTKNNHFPFLSTFPSPNEKQKIINLFLKSNLHHPHISYISIYIFLNESNGATTPPLTATASVLKSSMASGQVRSRMTGHTWSCTSERDTSSCSSRTSSAAWDVLRTWRRKKGWVKT